MIVSQHKLIVNSPVTA